MSEIWEFRRYDCWKIKGIDDEKGQKIRILIGYCNNSLVVIQASEHYHLLVLLAQVTSAVELFTATRKTRWWWRRRKQATQPSIKSNRFHWYWTTDQELSLPINSSTDWIQALRASNRRTTLSCTYVYHTDLQVSKSAWNTQFWEENCTAIC